MFAKYIKCGYLGILPVLAELSFRWAFGDSSVLDNFADKHYRFFRLYRFIKGLHSGLRMPVDRHKKLFIETV